MLLTAPTATVYAADPIREIGTEPLLTCSPRRLAGACAGLALLGGYQSIFLFAGFVTGALVHPARWTYLRSPSPWISAAAGALVVGLLVSWGQVLIGLSLFLGAFVPVSAPFGILLMLLFWLAHMDWPFDDGRFYVFVGPDLLFAGIIFGVLLATDVVRPIQWPKH